MGRGPFDSRYLRWSGFARAALRRGERTFASCSEFKTPFGRTSCKARIRDLDGGDRATPEEEALVGHLFRFRLTQFKEPNRRVEFVTLILQRFRSSRNLLDKRCILLRGLVH